MTSGKPKTDSTLKYYAKRYGPMAIGAAAAVAGTSLAITFAGFGAGGIAAGSVAASAMSKYGATYVGSAVLGCLQSAGAAGMGVGTKTVIGAMGAGATREAQKLFQSKKDGQTMDPDDSTKSKNKNKPVSKL